MENIEEFRWIPENTKTSEPTDAEYFMMILFNKICPYLTSITRYFPFSLLWQSRRFHYRYKEITEADDRIIGIANKNGFWFKISSFARDKTSLIIFGRFIPVKKGADENKLIEHFEKVFEKENIYISKPDTKTVKISFLKN